MFCCSGSFMTYWKIYEWAATSSSSSFYVKVDRVSRHTLANVFFLEARAAEIRWLITIINVSSRDLMMDRGCFAAASLTKLFLADADDESNRMLLAMICDEMIRSLWQWWLVSRWNWSICFSWHLNILSHSHTVPALQRKKMINITWNLGPLRALISMSFTPIGSWLDSALPSG